MKYSETKAIVSVIISWILAFILGFMLYKATYKPVIKIDFADHCIYKEKVLEFPKGYNYEKK